MRFWPDGVPVHNVKLYVRLSCGHHRVSLGWRGQVGDVYCCDVCHMLTNMVEISVTDETPRGWEWP